MAETAYGPPKTNPVTAVWHKLSARFHMASPYTKALLEGLLAVIALMILLILWMTFRAERTAENMQKFVPFETTKIMRGDEPVQADAKIIEAVENPANGPTTALPAAPIEGLSEEKDGLILPISRIEDDLTPFNAYKRPFTPIAGRHLISVVVVDFGLSESLSQAAIEKFPPEVSFALSPYADSPSDWGALARQHGHEFWLSLPMQSQKADDDQGPRTIMVQSSLQQNVDNITAVLGSAVGYTGLISTKDHAFASNDIDVTAIINQIYGRGLAFAESNPQGFAFGAAQAAQSNTPYVRNNFWLGDDLRPETFDLIIKAVELQAMKQGSAVVFIQPYPVVLNRVEEWMAGGEARGLQFAPLSAMAK